MRNQSLSADAADLRTLERQIVHEPFLIEDESDNRTAHTVRIDRPASSNRNYRHRSVYTYLPAIGALKRGQGRGRHEHQDHRSRLRAELKTDRARDDVVVTAGSAADVQ